MLGTRGNLKYTFYCNELPVGTGYICCCHYVTIHRVTRRRATVKWIHPVSNIGINANWSVSVLRCICPFTAASMEIKLFNSSQLVRPNARCIGAVGISSLKMKNVKEYVRVVGIWPKLTCGKMKFFRAFSSVVRQMPGYNSQRRGTARTIPN